MEIENQIPLVECLKEARSSCRIAPSPEIVKAVSVELNLSEDEARQAIIDYSQSLIDRRQMRRSI